MADDYPYMISNNKIKPIIDAIHNAAKPTKFSHEFLKQIGFNSSNDRAVVPLFKRLGFVHENGAPTSYYDELKDKTRREHALADRIRSLYSDLFSINTKINEANEDDIKGAMSRVTGKDSQTINRYYATFKTLCGLAKFGTVSIPVPKEIANTPLPEEGAQLELAKSSSGIKTAFHYNIQIHLPATTDISVYNSIFKSLRDNLLG